MASKDVLLLTASAPSSMLTQSDPLECVQVFEGAVLASISLASLLELGPPNPNDLLSVSSFSRLSGSRTKGLLCHCTFDIADEPQSYLLLLFFFFNERLG